jgi:hypothetical protein
MGDWAEENWDEILEMNPLPDSRPKCAVPGCARERRAKGLCLTHYQMARAKFDEEFGQRVRKAQSESHKRRRAREVSPDYQRMVATLGDPAPDPEPQQQPDGGPHWSEPEFWQRLAPETVEDDPGVALPDARGAGGRQGATPPTPTSPEGSENEGQERS